MTMTMTLTSEPKLKRRRSKKPLSAAAFPFLEQLKIETQAPDRELAKSLDVSVRQVQRIIRLLSEQKLISITRQRYKHPQFGWCNTRTIKRV